jgi:hypothetical protein
MIAGNVEFAFLLIKFWLIEAFSPFESCRGTSRAFTLPPLQSKATSAVLLVHGVLDGVSLDVEERGFAAAW